MYLIAHRGNTHGPKIDMENRPEYLLKAINNGFQVELDVWLIEDNLYLGHDKPQYKISIDFLLYHKNKIWCHAKNIEALEELLGYGLHTFWHQNDDYTITSRGYIWAYPDKRMESGGIYVMPERDDTYVPLSAEGVCSDYVGQLDKLCIEDGRSDHSTGG